MNRTLGIVFAVFKRHIGKLKKNPGLFVPSLMLPILFFVAFAGSLSAVADTPDFGYPDYTAFEFVFVLMLGAAFCGVFTGIALAEDYESGFARRMMLSAPRRMAIVAGFLLAALLQAVIVSAVLFAIAAAADMMVEGSVLEIAAVFVLALILCADVTLFSAGVALRIRSVQAGPIMLLPVFAALFLTPAYTPRELLSGWLQTAAGLNPLTALLEAGRALMIGEPEGVGRAFAAALGLGVILLLFAATGMRSAEGRASSWRGPLRARRSQA